MVRRNLGLPHRLISKNFNCVIWDYGIFKPKTEYLCSIQIAKKSWKNLTSYGLKNHANCHNIQFTHHRAGADAEVCAKLSLLGFERLLITENEELPALFSKNLKVL